MTDTTDLVEPTQDEATADLAFVSPLHIALNSGALPAHVAAAVRWLGQQNDILFQAVSMLELKVADLEGRMDEVQTGVPQGVAETPATAQTPAKAKADAAPAAAASTDAPTGSATLSGKAG